VEGSELSTSFCKDTCIETWYEKRTATKLRYRMSASRVTVCQAVV
jgi:hypothetical protein